MELIKCKDCLWSTHKNGTRLGCEKVKGYVVPINQEVYNCDKYIKRELETKDVDRQWED